MRIDGAWAKVLYIADFKVKGLVYPFKELVLRHEVGWVHESNWSLAGHYFIINGSLFISFPAKDQQIILFLICQWVNSSWSSGFYYEVVEPISYQYIYN
jgi:hypothetical protein